jgi:hypothetical protein
VNESRTHGRAACALLLGLRSVPGFHQFDLDPWSAVVAGVSIYDINIINKSSASSLALYKVYKGRDSVSTRRSGNTPDQQAKRAGPVRPKLGPVRPSQPQPHSLTPHTRSDATMMTPLAVSGAAVRHRSAPRSHQKPKAERSAWRARN